MPKISYIEKNFAPATIQVIEQANSIIKEYQGDGLNLTLRQLYYQFVSRDTFPDERKWMWDTAKRKWTKDENGTKNADPNYKWLGTIINDGRLAGLIDWDAIEDRARNLQGNSHWINPGQIVRAASRSFRLDHWKNQEHYVEVWVEKEALVGVISSICEDLDVSYFACKGYVSQSEMWNAAQRMESCIDEGQRPVIIHLGDHDPSGIDMTRDIDDRHDLFLAAIDGSVEVRRIALNMDQVEEYNPPPNPAKLTDSRAEGYVSKYGDESWELDALEPRMMRDLIKDTVEEYRDEDLYRETIDKEDEYKSILKRVEDNWESL